MGWAFGVTIGFAIISAILAAFLSQVNGTPIVGNFIASIVEAIIKSLSIRSLTLPQ
jgi:ABC-type thiamin/hydroxymethylpyrimidine transport system permease subunit